MQMIDGKSGGESEEKLEYFEQLFKAIWNVLFMSEDLIEYCSEDVLSVDVGKVIGTTLLGIVQIIPSHFIAFYSLNEETNEFILSTVIPEKNEEIARKKFERLIEEGYFAWGLRQPKISTFRIQDEKDPKKEENILLTPLMTGTRISGVIIISPREDADKIPKEILRVIEFVLRQAAFAIENTQLYGALKKEHENLEKAYVSVEEKVRQRTAELAIMKDRAEAASKAKSQFLAVMSHEIRTPMNAVMGMTELLLETELTALQREYGEVVMNSADLLLSVINDILDFSKIEAGKLELEIIDFNLRDFLEEVSDLLALRAHQKNLEYASVIDSDLPSNFKGDPVRLRQILINLGGNAIKFTSAGSVTIHTSLVDSENGKTTIRFAVRDTGIGISRDQADRLFKPFSQADASTTRKYGGTGLGLIISKQLAEKMDGEMGVESEEKKGSTFWFTVKLERQAQEEEEPFVLPEEFSGMRALIVDRSELNSLILGEMLSRCGIRPDTCNDCGTAILKILKSLKEEEPYHLAFVDHLMREEDGVSLAGFVKQNDKSAKTLMILMTTFGKPIDADEILDHGYVSFINRPIKRSQLFGCILKVLGRGESAEIPREREKVTKITKEQRGRYRLLLADDSTTNQKLAQRMLEKEGYNVDIVNNGLEALEAFEKNIYDMILMDIEMPGMDGFAATRAIREKESSGGTKIPIIALTAHAMKEYLDMCIESGMDDYVTKPLRSKQLFEKIEKYLPEFEDIEIKPSVEKPDLTTSTPSEEKGVAAVKNIFDREELLDRLEGDEELCEELTINTFLKEAPGWIESLKNACLEKDLKQITFKGHTIKGSSANICANNLMEVAAKIEKAGFSENLDEIKILVPKLEEEFERLKAVLLEKRV